MEASSTSAPAVVPVLPGLAPCSFFSRSTAVNPVRSAVPDPDQSLTARAQGAAAVPRRNYSMSVKGKVLAVAATLTLVGGTGVAALATAGAANAATPSCGYNCIDVFSHQFGD